MIHKTIKIMTIGLLFITSLSVFSHGDEKHEKNNPLFTGNDTEVAIVVSQLHEALLAGEQEVIKDILDDQVLIFEGSGAERSYSEYASHHMMSDMAFLSKMNIELIERQIMIRGDIAIASSRSKINGQYKDMNIDKISIETLVLEKKNNQWKVVRVHWS